MTAKPKWAVAKWFPLPNGERVTKYWCRDGGVSDWAGTDGLSPITTWPTKRAAEDAYRLFGRGDVRDIRVVKLDTIPGANTKPLPPTVQAALAKAKETAVTEPEVSHDDSPEPLEPATVQVPAEVDAELFPDLRSPRGRQAWSPIIYARKVDSEKAGIVREHADTTEHTYDPQQRAQVRSAVARQIERKTGRPTGDPMPTDEARKLTDRIKFDAEQLWDKVIDAFLGRADLALGYASWDDYCTQEFPTSRLRLPREERSEVVPSLRDAGFSDRAIESATGISRRTLIRDRQRQSGGDNVTTSGSDVDEDAVVDAEIVEPKPVTGLDGKTYQPKRPNNKRQPEPDSTPADDNFIATRFTESPNIWAYIDAVREIGLYTGDDLDLVTPLTADDLPEPPKWLSNGGAEFFRGQADRLRAALPRIHELIELLERRAKDGAESDRTASVG